MRNNVRDERWRRLVSGLILIIFAIGTASAAEAGADVWEAHSKEYKKYRKSVRVDERLLAVRSLKDADCGKAADCLGDFILKDNSDIVANAAVEVLGGFKSDGAAETVAKELKKRGGEARDLLYCEAAARVNNPLLLSEFLKLAKQKDRRFVILALEGLGQLRQPSAEATAVLIEAAKQDKDYGLRITAVTSLAQTPMPGAVAELAELAAAVPGCVRETALRGLTLLTGQNFGADLAAWQKWVAGAGKNFQPDPAALAGRRLESVTINGLDYRDFYGINLAGKRVLFVLDKSGSMDEGTTVKRIDGVKAELNRFVGILDESVGFNMIFFSNEINFWKGKLLLQGSDKNKVSALAFIKATRPGGSTFTDTAMQRAFKEVVVPQQVEELVLLTDGIPFRNGAAIDPDTVAQLIKELNRFQKVRVHTVGCFAGASDRGANSEHDQLSKFLARIAAENWGVFKEVTDK